jgi:hypothetical protein
MMFQPLHETFKIFCNPFFTCEVRIRNCSRMHTNCFACRRLPKEVKEARPRVLSHLNLQVLQSCIRDKTSQKLTGLKT